MSNETAGPTPDPTDGTPDNAPDPQGDGWQAVPNREVVSDTASESTEADTEVVRGSTDASGDEVARSDDLDATVVPEVTPPKTSGLNIGIWISTVIGAVVLVLLLVFILQNNVSTKIHFFGWTFSLPLGVALLLTAVGGLLIAGVIGSIRILQLSHRLRKVGKALK